MVAAVAEARSCEEGELQVERGKALRGFARPAHARKLKRGALFSTPLSVGQLRRLQILYAL